MSSNWHYRDVDERDLCLLSSTVLSRKSTKNLLLLQKKKKLSSCFANDADYCCVVDGCC
jgi:hypothetical protein